LLTYDPQDLVSNRDLIRSVKCLACEKLLEIKAFLAHCKDCRLTNGVPAFLNEKRKYSGKTEQISCEHFENSISLSAKNLFDESRLFSQNKESELSPDDQALPRSPPEVSQENKTEPPAHALVKSESENEKYNDYSTALLTPVRSKVENKKLSQALTSAGK